MDRRSSRKQKNALSVADTLRAYKEGLVDTDYADDNDDLKLFDEVDEDDYQRLARKKILEGDAFVEDDDGRGYADYGQNEWESDHDSDSALDDDDNENPRSAKFSSSKGKNPAKKVKPVQKENQISSFFANATKKQQQPSTAQTNEMDSDFMQSILQDVDNLAETRVKKKIKLTDAPPHPPPTTSALSSYSSEYQHPQKQSRVSIKLESAFEDKMNDLVLSTQPENNDPDEMDLSPSTIPDSQPIKTETINDNDDDDNDEEEEEDSGTYNGTKIVALKKPKTSKIASSVVVSSLKKYEKPVEKKSTVATVVNAPLNSGYQNWDAVKNQMSVVGGDVVGASKSIRFSECLEEDGSLKIFWIDATEVAGSLYVFGKVATKDGFVSCSLTIGGMERNVFVLPRQRICENGVETDQEVTMGDVYTEISDLLMENKIKKFDSYSTSRKYAFEIPGVPAVSDYLKVIYPFSEPPIPRESTGKTFSHVFGTHQSQLELFILKRKIMGPCWLHVKDPVFNPNNVTWCKFSVNVNNPKSVTVIKETEIVAPPLVVMSLSMVVAMNKKTHANEIVALSATIYDDVKLDQDENHGNPRRFSIVRLCQDTVWPVGFQELAQNRSVRIEMVSNESALLNNFIAKLHRFDPDVIVGHNFIGFGLDVLLRRMKDLNTQFWSRVGRLIRKQWPKLQIGAGGMGDTTFEERAVVSGRLICDTYLAAKESVRAKSYSLTSLAASELKWNREEINHDQIQEYFWDKNGLYRLVELCEFDAYICISLMFKFQYLQLSRQLTNLAGNLWSKTLMSGKADRNEYLLLHEFYNNKFIVPDKRFIKKAVKEVEDDDDEGKAATTATTGRRKPAYAGGLVLEPKKGFYDKYVILFDFNSLYPSIIQEYNICFTTVERKVDADGNDDAVPEIPDSSLEKGILPKLLRTLVSRRRQVKSLMKDPKNSASLNAQYEIRQQALKLTANSMYGCLGFTHSRFYAKQIAMLVTSKGREILQETASLAAEKNYEVIYGDTDSIMIHSNTEDMAQVRRICAEFKKAVNERYTLLELEVDHLYKRMLLLKKKKYAGLAVIEKNGVVETQMEIKGLDLVRRDWCGLAQDSSMRVLNELFGESGQDERMDTIFKYLQSVGQEVKDGIIPLEKFMIIKALTKKPEAYADAKTQPHVQVALKMRAANIPVRAGDTVPYVVCTDTRVDKTAELSIAQRAQPPYEVQKKDSPFKIDYDWYLENQVHPCISRLLTPIELADPVQIAELLGVDGTKFHQKQTYGDVRVAEDTIQTSTAGMGFNERFANVEKWKPKCLGCKQAYEFEPVVRISRAGGVSSALDCPGCRRRYNTTGLIVSLRREIERCFQKWDTSAYVCDDYGHKRHDISASGVYCIMQDGAVVRREYGDEIMRLQIIYYHSLFDVSMIKNPENPLRLFDKEVEEDAQAQAIQDEAELQRLSNYAKMYVDVHAGYIVDLRFLWKDLFEE